MNLLQLMMVALLVLSGMGVALLGSVKIPLSQRLNMDDRRVGGLVSLFGLILGPVMLAAGFLTDSLDWKFIVIGGSILFAGSLIVLGFAKKYLDALVAIVLFSAAWGILINIGNVLTPLAFKGSTEAFAFNLANVFFGLGAFLTPLAISRLIRVWPLSRTLWLLAALTLLPGLLSLGVDFRDLQPHSSATERSWGIEILLGDPVLWMCGFGLFFYGPLEASLGAWATSFLVERGVKVETAPNWLSGFWLTYMGARLLAAFALGGIDRLPLLLTLSLLCIVVLAAIVACRDRSLAIALVMLAGFIFGPIFPTLIGLLLGHFPRPLHGRAVGLFFAIGGIGWTMIPMLIGAYARRTSIQRSFQIAVVAAMCLSLVAFALSQVWTDSLFFRLTL